MPAIPSDFGEKEFETHLYTQLGGSNPSVWSPTQVFEAYIGIDRAMFLYDARLWPLFGVTVPPVGVFLNRLDMPFLWRRRKRGNVPNFRLNLFIQAKRSHYYRWRPERLAKELPRKVPCWRFDVVPRQQRALERVAQHLGDRALMVYAAPAFHRYSQLNSHAFHGSVLTNSTFPLIERLHGHRRWYFTGSGGDGVANPDPERIEGVGLTEMINGYVSRLSSESSGTATEHLGILVERIETGLKEAVSGNDDRMAAYFQRSRQIDAVAGSYEEFGPSERAFLRVAAFASVFNLEWYALGGTERAA
jgi:hypothetical protein